MFFSGGNKGLLIHDVLAELNLIFLKAKVNGNV